MQSRLPNAWVNKLFERILLRYGSEWTRRWEGIDMQAVKDDWAEELAGFHAHPDALAYGLTNLPPDKPPTVQQFAAICNRSPEPAQPRLPAPKATDAVVKKALEAIKPAAGGPLAWAERLRAKEIALVRLTPFQRDAWRAVLGDDSKPRETEGTHEL